MLCSSNRLQRVRPTFRKSGVFTFVGSPNAEARALYVRRSSSPAEHSDLTNNCNAWKKARGMPVSMKPMHVSLGRVPASTIVAYPTKIEHSGQKGGVQSACKFKSSQCLQVEIGPGAVCPDNREFCLDCRPRFAHQSLRKGKTGELFPRRSSQ